MPTPITILNVNGPYREPREPAFSYDYSVQRSNWPTPQGVRIKVAITEELEYFKSKLLEVTGGSPGKQLIINRMLTRVIADHKFQIAENEGMFLERVDVMVGPFTGPLVHLFPALEARIAGVKEEVRKQIREKVGI
jgi:hypothetical protein